MEDTESTNPLPPVELAEEPDAGPPVKKPFNKPVKPGKKALIAWILAGLMTAAAGTFAWLYFNKDSAPPAAEEPAPTSSQTDNIPAEEEVQRAVYQATVGKFKLDLPLTYAVVEKLDSGFEGGPATSVEIGLVDSDTPGVVTTNPAQAFTIFARPEDGATLASNTRTAALDDNELAERQADTTFAETPARVYQASGLFTTRHIVLVKSGVVYEITLLHDNAPQTAIFEAVKAGWSFVE